MSMWKPLPLTLQEPEKAPAKNCDIEPGHYQERTQGTLLGVRV